MSKTFIESIIPFITSMRKGVDEGASISLKPFEPGQELLEGSKIYFNRNIDWNTFLSNLSYPGPDSESGTHYLISCEGEFDFHIFAASATIDESTTLYVLINTYETEETEEMKILYSNINIPAEQSPTGQEIKAGWIDEVGLDGSYTVHCNATNLEMNDGGEGWNGTIIGQAE